MCLLSKGVQDFRCYICYWAENRHRLRWKSPIQSYMYRYVRANCLRYARVCLVLCACVCCALLSLCKPIFSIPISTIWDNRGDIFSHAPIRPGLPPLRGETWGGIEWEPTPPPYPHVFARNRTGRVGVPTHPPYRIVFARNWTGRVLHDVGGFRFELWGLWPPWMWGSEWLGDTTLSTPVLRVPAPVRLALHKKKGVPVG
jgi:hypothetical protein